MSDANDLIMGANVEGAKFETIGDIVQGNIAKIGDKQQSRKWRSDGKLGDLAFWDDGSPIWQVRIDVQTDMRDPSVKADDGIRALYVRAGSDLRRAIQEAVRESGSKELLVGAFLGVQLTGKEQSGPMPASNDKKLYTAVYRAPNPGSQMLMGDQAVQNGQQQPVYQQPAQQPYNQGGFVQPGQQAFNNTGQPQQLQPSQQFTYQPAQQQQPAFNNPIAQAMANELQQQQAAYQPPVQMPQQSAQAELQQAQQQYGVPQPNPTMQHANGQPGMQQPAANPANDPKVQALLAQVNPNQQ